MTIDSVTRAPRERSSEARAAAPTKPNPVQYQEPPAAGAHAASHLVNEDATPGAGVLPSHAHRSGKEVDSGAG